MKHYTGLTNQDLNLPVPAGTSGEVAILTSGTGVAQLGYLNGLGAFVAFTDAAATLTNDADTVVFCGAQPSLVARITGSAGAFNISVAHGY